MSIVYPCLFFMKRYTPRAYSRKKPRAYPQKQYKKGGAIAPPFPRKDHSISILCSSSLFGVSFGIVTFRMPFSYFALMSSLRISPT